MFRIIKVIFLKKTLRICTFFKIKTTNYHKNDTSHNYRMQKIWYRWFSGVCKINKTLEMLNFIGLLVIVTTVLVVRASTDAVVHPGTSS